MYAQPDDPVFALVPEEFNYHANSIYHSMGSPSLTSKNIWHVYLEMRDRLEEIHAKAEEDTEYIELWEVQEKLMAATEDEGKSGSPYELLPGKELAGGIENREEDGSFYMGGVNGGLGLGMYRYLANEISQADEET